MCAHVHVVTEEGGGTAEGRLRRRDVEKIQLDLWRASYARQREALCHGAKLRTG